MAARASKRNRQQQRQQQELQPREQQGLHQIEQHESQERQSLSLSPPPLQQHGVTNGNGNVVDESPLRLFGEAKENINSLYQRLNVCVDKANRFFSKIDPEAIENVDLNKLRRLNESIESIRGILSRNHMKVAFFGNTSSGKSTSISAILHDDNVLPCGDGITTKCFLQIQGTQDDEAYVVVQEKNKPKVKKPISSIAQMANAVNENSLDSSTLLKIFLPTSKCSLLKYDVVFLDSPGFGADANVDEWIDDYCYDADVFVLVSNSRSALHVWEKNFFLKVSQKLSKPNIFVLNNQFDLFFTGRNFSTDVNQARERCIKPAVDFLSQELKISSEDEARQRIFCVSAAETLDARCPITGSSGGSTVKGYKQRSEEFQTFEKSFEESLSKSALKTKFMKHCEKGRAIVEELTSILNNTRTLVSNGSAKKFNELQNHQERKKRFDTIFYANELNLQKKIIETKKRIQIVSDTEFDNEVRRLSRAVEDFDLEFSTDQTQLKYYKEQLYLHVENRLSENLKTRIHSVINKHIIPFNKNICDFSTLLSKERQQSVIGFIGSQTYVQDDLFDLKIYKKFYTEFQEDLEFRFSLGLVSIIRKIQSKFSPSKSASNETTTTMKADTDVISIFERFIMNPPQSQTTVGSLAVGGVLVRTLGLKVIAIGSVLYVALYAYEKLTWTDSAKERALKAQYVRYARRGLQGCVPIISEHIARSVEQKMTATSSKLKEQMDVESAEVCEKISLLRASLEKLKSCEDFTCQLLGDNNVLMNEFVAFAASFLS